MIEVKVPGYREGRGYIKITPGLTSAYRGKFVKWTGVWAAADVASFTHGQAYTGAAKYELATSGDALTVAVYPFNKLLYKPENSETASDYVSSGDGIITYHGGEYETDQYATTDTWSGVIPGTLLYLDANSVLTTSHHAFPTVPPRAELVGVVTGYNSNYSARGKLWFRLLPYTPITSGHLGL